MKKYNLGLIGDLFLVEENDFGEDDLCKYRLTQYGIKDCYYMDLDDPNGFTILYSEDDKEHKKLLKKMRRFGKKLYK